jgi:CIC family chloride channel protein
LVGILALAAPEILGTGYVWVELAILEKLSLTTILLLLVLKAPAMALTIGSGGSGGVFAPTVTVGGMLGAAVGLLVNHLAPAAGMPVAAFVVVGMAAVFSGAARTPISTLIMVAEMTGGYDLIVPAMLANILAFMVQRSLTAGSRYPTLYESQVPSREDSPLHRGVFVRRTLDLLDQEGVETSQFRLPRLVNLLRFGESIPIADGEGKLVAVIVGRGSELADRTVVETLGKLQGVTAVAVMRKGELLVPRGDTRFREGDQLLAVTASAVDRDLSRLAMATSVDDESEVAPERGF